MKWAERSTPGGPSPPSCTPTYRKLRPTALTASATLPAEGASSPGTGTATRLDREPRGCGLRCTGSSGARLQQTEREDG